MINQKTLHSILDYDPNTGVFTWKAGRRKGLKAGCVAHSTETSKYIVIRYNKQNYYAHRLAWVYINGEQPSQIDHINGNGLDNRIANLRIATTVMNGQNRPLGSRNKSGQLGVCYLKSVGKWQASIGINKKNVKLGRYKTLKKAIAARKKAEREVGYHANHGRKLKA